VRPVIPAKPGTQIDGRQSSDFLTELTFPAGDIGSGGT